MFKKFVHFISFRYIKSRLITLFAVAGIAIGVMVLIVVISVMDGFIKEFKSRLKGSLSDIIITVRANKMNYDQIEDKISKLKNIKACAPHLDGLILIGTGRFYAGGVVLGVDHEKEYKVGKLKQYLVTAFKSHKLATEKIFENNVKRNYRKEMTWKPKVGEIVTEDGIYPAGVRIICEKSVKNIKKVTNSTPMRSMLSFVAYTIGKNGKILFIEEDLSLEEIKDIPKFSEESKNKWQAYFNDLTQSFNNRALVKYMSFYDENLRTGEGDIDPLKPFYVEEEGVRPIIMGYELMKNLHIKRGDEIALMTGQRNEKNELKSISRKFMVVGSFRSGWHEIDIRMCYTRRSDLRGFIDWPNDVKEVCVSLKDPSIAEKTKFEIQNILDDSNMLGASFSVEKWEDRRRTFLSAIQLERDVMKFILFFIVLLALATIMIILILLVKEKTKDIGILKSMGVSNGEIMWIFIFNGFLISFLGVLLGCLLGSYISTNVNNIANLIFEMTGFRVFPRDIYYLDKIPSELNLWNIFSIVIPTLICSVIFCIVPAYFAAKLEPVKALGSEFQVRKKSIFSRFFGFCKNFVNGPKVDKSITRMTNDFFSAEKLSKEYEMGTEKLEILKNLNIKIEKGKISVITGQSGSGKSTILHLLGLLDSATSGRVYLDGLSVQSISNDQKSKIRSKKIGFIFQFYHLFPEFSALENVLIASMIEESIFSWPLLKKKKIQQAKDLLGQFGLDKRLDHLPHQLSGGERQRVAIARALINDPEIVLCDEPTGNLDQENSKSIQDLIWKLNKNHQQTFVIVTHDLKIAAKADHLYHLENGQLRKEKNRG